MEFQRYAYLRRAASEEAALYVCMIWLIREHSGKVIGREALDTRDKLVRFSDVLAGTIFYVPVGHRILVQL